MKFIYKIILLHSITIIALNHSYGSGAAFNFGGIQYLKADKIIYNAQKNTATAKGNVKIIQDDGYIEAESVVIDTINKRIWLAGPVYGESKENKFLASKLYYDDKTKASYINSARLRLQNDEILSAAKVEANNTTKISTLYDSAYTPCTQCIKNAPIWEINATKTEIDFKKHNIKYRNAYFKVAGYKVLYLPYFSHSLSSAEASSGILKPEIEKGTIKIPFYYRHKPNMDMTYSPRFNKKYFLHELEFRHLVESGTYQINGSYNKSKISTQDNNGTENTKKLDRYYVNSFGNFDVDHTKIGFDLSRVSDKSYLKNFYKDYRSYLKSDIFYTNFAPEGYNHVEFIHFQGLKANDSQYTNPAALPNLVIRRDFNLENDFDFSLNEDLIQYNEGTYKNITRSSFDLQLSKSYYGDNGHIITSGIKNKTDIYSLQRAYLLGQTTKNKNLIRNVPEISTNASAPFFLYSKENIFVIEPQANLIVSPTTNKLNKYQLIDSPIYEIDENNIFAYSRYNGLDYFEQGTRFNYGFNNYAGGDGWQFSTFLGQSIKSNTKSNNSKSDYVGKINYAISDNFEIYYRLQRKNKNMKPLRDEISVWGKIDKLTLQNIWMNLRNLKENASIYNYWSSVNINILKQNYTSASYQISDNTTIFGDIRMDFSDKNKTKVINDSIGISYNYDCLSFAVKISNDYLHDPIRNIKKSRTYGIKFGLKSINL